MSTHISTWIVLDTCHLCQVIMLTKRWRVELVNCIGSGTGERTGKRKRDIILCLYQRSGEDVAIGLHCKFILQLYNGVCMARS
jgi:hypothetical protein